MSKHVPWRAGQVAAMILAIAGPEALAEMNRILPVRVRPGEPEVERPPDTAAMSAAEEKRARKAAKRLRESGRG